MYKLVTVPNTILNKPSRKVDTFNKQLVKIVKEMEETLNAQVDPQGVGLAAPQVGLDMAIFIMKPTPRAATEICINPVILQTSKPQTPKPTADEDDEKPLEGCLSIPRIWSPVQRPRRVQLEYQDIHGEKKQVWFTGFKAVIVQHEVDHLDGVLFTQRALEQKSQLYEEKNGKLIPRSL